MGQVTHRTDDSPARWTFPITPSDSADLSSYVRAIYVGGTAGAIAYHDWDGNARSTGTLQQGWHPIEARRVLSTGTTATDMTGGV